MQIEWVIVVSNDDLFFVFLKSACFIPLTQMNSKEWSRKVVKITQK